MDFIMSALRSEGIFASDIRLGLISKDTIAFLYKKFACENNAISALVTAKDGSATGYIRHCRDDLYEIMLCRECLVTDFVGATRVIANAQKCRQGIA